jgi:hypothetical protein
MLARAIRTAKEKAREEVGIKSPGAAIRLLGRKYPKCGEKEIAFDARWEGLD